MVGAPLQTKPRPSIWLSLAGYASAAAALLLIVWGMLLIFSGGEEVASSPASDQAQVAAYASPTPTDLTILIPTAVVEQALLAESPSATTTLDIIPSAEISRADTTGESEAAGYAQQYDANSAALSAPPGQTEAVMLGSASPASGETGLPEGIGGGLGETAGSLSLPPIPQTASTIVVEEIPLPPTIKATERQDEDEVARGSAPSAAAMATPIALPPTYVFSAPTSSDGTLTTIPAESLTPPSEAQAQGNDIWPGALLVGMGGVLFMITVIWLFRQRRRG